jgi:type IV pilus assembly protein PilW
MRTMQTIATRRRASRGFTTAEVLAGSALTLMLMGSMQSFQQSQLKALGTQAVYAGSQNVTRSAIDLMTRDLRMATYDPTGTALGVSPGPTCPGVKQGIVEATPTRIRFQQDLDGNGVIGGAREDVTYALSGNSIVRIEGNAAPLEVVSGVAEGGLRFEYFFGANLTPLTPHGSPLALSSGERDCIEKVRITLAATVAANAAVRKPLHSTAESEIAIRNRSLDKF